MNSYNLFGNFSQAVIADKTMYVSGQLGLNPEVMLSLIRPRVSGYF